tara:strand:+ start:159 stop:518 length:360 start_codon:yes stop_codon:yes gene_type:complete
MLIKYTRLEEPDNFKKELGRDVKKARAVNNKVAGLLEQTEAVLNNDALTPKVASEVNLLTLLEVDKLMNILLLLKSNLEHFEGEPEPELLNEDQKEINPKDQLDNLISKIEGIADLDKQ